MRTGLLSTMIALAAAGCGASDSEIRDAKTSGYRTDFAIVYSETLAAVRELYPNLVEDARIGTIKTAWHWVRVAEGGDEQQIPSQSQQMSPTNQPSAFQATTSLRKNYFVRFEVHVVGGRPWRVRVHAQASSWRAGEQPVPLHGADVPGWLGPRKDALEVAIHKRLKKYAVRLKVESEAQRQARGQRSGGGGDLKRFGANLPAGAARAIAEVERAAGARDVGQLRPLMADEFTYSFGDSPSAETAIVMWQADPTILAELGKALGAGCAQDQEGQVVCPAAFASDPNFTGYRAGFRNLGGAWKMVFFVAGD